MVSRVLEAQYLFRDTHFRKNLSLVNFSVLLTLNLFSLITTFPRYFFYEWFFPENDDIG